MTTFEHFVVFYLACQILFPAVSGLYALAFLGVYINRTWKER